MTLDQESLVRVQEVAPFRIPPEIEKCVRFWSWAPPRLFGNVISGLASHGAIAYRPLGYRVEDPCEQTAGPGTGIMDLLILKMLALESMNGWAIGQGLRRLSSDVLQVSDGSLYPALHKLEQQGWITAEWRASENNRRAKFYSLSRAGRRQLEVETSNWDRLVAAISAVIRLQEA